MAPQPDNEGIGLPQKLDLVPAPALQAAKPTASGTTRRAPSVEARSTSVEPHAADPEEEVRTLRRVERVLREHNPRFALALLSDLDRSVPQGKLMEEREAARTVATCELEGATPAASDQAAAYAARFSGSVYASRVQQAYGVETQRRVNGSRTRRRQTSTNEHLISRFNRRTNAGSRRLQQRR